MHRLVQGIASAGITTSHGKRFWCSYSKTRAERDVASHASWVKRSLATKGPDLAARLDIEYSTGTVWMGEHTVASAKRPVPPNVDPASIIYDERLVVRPWVDVSALAMESGLTGEEIRGLLEANPQLTAPGVAASTRDLCFRGSERRAKCCLGTGC